MPAKKTSARRSKSFKRCSRQGKPGCSRKKKSCSWNSRRSPRCQPKGSRQTSRRRTKSKQSKQRSKRSKVSSGLMNAEEIEKAVANRKCATTKVDGRAHGCAESCAWDPRLKRCVSEQETENNLGKFMDGSKYLTFRSNKTPKFSFRIEISEKTLWGDYKGAIRFSPVTGKLHLCYGPMFDGNGSSRSKRPLLNMLVKPNLGRDLWSWYENHGKAYQKRKLREFGQERFPYADVYGLPGASYQLSWAECMYLKEKMPGGLEVLASAPTECPPALKDLTNMEDCLPEMGDRYDREEALFFDEQRDDYDAYKVLGHRPSKMKNIFDEDDEDDDDKKAKKKRPPAKRSPVPRDFQTTLIGSEKLTPSLKREFDKLKKDGDLVSSERGERGDRVPMGIPVDVRCTRVDGRERLPRDFFDGKHMEAMFLACQEQMRQVKANVLNGRVEHRITMDSNRRLDGVFLRQLIKGFNANGEEYDSLTELDEEFTVTDLYNLLYNIRNDAFGESEDVRGVVFSDACQDAIRNIHAMIAAGAARISEASNLPLNAETVGYLADFISSKFAAKILRAFIHDIRQCTSDEEPPYLSDLDPIDFSLSDDTIQTPERPDASRQGAHFVKCCDAAFLRGLGSILNGTDDPDAVTYNRAEKRLMSRYKGTEKKRTQRRTKETPSSSDSD